MQLSNNILFLQNKSTCLGIKKKNDLGGNSHDPPCARLKINGTVTSHKPGKRNKKTQIKIDVLGGLV
jgi:hypothetical protein